MTRRETLAAALVRRVYGGDGSCDVDLVNDLLSAMAESEEQGGEGSGRYTDHRMRDGSVVRSFWASGDVEEVGS